MILAYNQLSLDNKAILEEAGQAMNNSLISLEEFATIKQKYPVGLYTPNLFIRIGIGLLTVVIVLMSFGLLCLMTNISSEAGFGALCIFSALAAYAGLEFVIQQKKHYRSGLDDALMWLSAAFLIMAVNLLASNISYLGQSILVFVVAAYCTLRFANSLMSGIALISFMAIVFYTIIPLGDAAKASMPFILMTLALVIYLLIRKNNSVAQLKYYVSCCTMTEMLSLIVLYTVANFFVVREVSNELFGLRLSEGASIPGGWFFWLATILIPPVYITAGLWQKNAILLRTGLLLLAATIFTVYHYYPPGKPEISITIIGFVLIGVAYLSMRFFRTSKYGITSKTINDPNLPGMAQIEALILSETFHQAPAADQGHHTEFGGGSGGGGGATGQY
jgi:hypothetical protein